MSEKVFDVENENTSEGAKQVVENPEVTHCDKSTQESECQDKPVIHENMCDDSNEHSNMASGDTKTFQDELNRLSDGIAALGKLFEAKILHTTHEEKIVDQMHRELQKYKEDMYSQLVRPILLDIIEIRNSILRVSEVHHLKPQEEQSIPLSTFELYASDVQEILEKNNIEIFRCDKNSDFVPVRQRAIKKVSTPDQSLHGKVEMSLSDGYSYLGKVISAEKIAVYVYEPQTTKMELNNEEVEANG